MTWLDTKVRTTEVNSNIGNNVAIELYTENKKFFELNDNTTGIDIDGYLFFPEQVEGDESFSHREFMRTKIMSGGEFVTRGQYIPKEFSFNTIIDIEPNELDKYYDIFSLMENKVCTVTSPYIGGMFKAEVKISVVNPESSPHVIECKVEIKEIPSVMERLKGDPTIKYPSINTISDVEVKERTTSKPQTQNTGERDIYDDYTSSRSRQF